MRGKADPADVALLNAVIEGAGVTPAEFAAKWVLRDRGTVLDWIAGAHGIPRVVVNQLHEWRKEQQQKPKSRRASAAR